MGRPRKTGRLRRLVLGASLALLAAGGASTLTGQQPAPGGVEPRNAAVAATLPLAAALPEDRPLPINLPTALKLAKARPLDIALASRRLEIAQAQLDRASVLWLPSIYLGVDYARHDGQIQAIEGRVFTTSRSSFMAGAGPSMVFGVTDALFAPLAARQVLRAREAEVQAAINDALLSTSEAYFDVQQARGEAAGSVDAARRADEVVRRARTLSEGLVPKVEVNRAEAELARRRQAAEYARERWETASAELARVLRLPPSALVVPTEAPHMTVELVDQRVCADDLVALGLSSRPELARDQALVQATLARLRQERARPLLPSLLVRGNATNPAGSLSTGVFGGGVNDGMTNFGARNSVDVQVLWELRNLGCGDKAAIGERRAESEAAAVELLRTQDRVAAEVVRAHAQVRRSANRIAEAERGLVNARESAEKNIAGMGETRRVGDAITLVFRPQEVVAAVQALDQAYRDYFGAAADFNRAQFRLYRALGHPAQHLLQPGRAAEVCAAEGLHTGTHPPSGPLPAGQGNLKPN
jgi:outer membrane protein TolC